MSKDQRPVMIFAAGFGTRMRELTRDRPKPLVNVAGRPLIDHALDLVDDRPVTVNTHYFEDQMSAHLAHRRNLKISQESEILETGGGLKHALLLLGPDPIITLNSDAVWAGPNPLGILETVWDPDRMDALLMLVPKQRAVGFTRPGNFTVNADGRIHRDPEGLVYTGAQIIKTHDLAEISEAKFSLRDVWTRIGDRDRMFGIEYAGYWADVGTPEGIPLAEQMLKDHHV